MIQRHTVKTKLTSTGKPRRIFRWRQYGVGDTICIPIDPEKEDRYKVQARVMTAALMTIARKPRRHRWRFKTKNCYKRILLIRLPNAVVR